MVYCSLVSTRAVHIEPAGDLSTDDFQLALQRFISCRGTIEIIPSDNGTNFVGANNKMKAYLKQLDQVSIKSYMCGKNINWIFNPPTSPWVGGVWESLVNSVKKTLKAIVKGRISTENCLCTFLWEVDAILNSQSLTAISDYINDLEPLTSNHFLTGVSSTNYSPGVFHSNEVELRKKWPAVQAAANMFWVRWTCEYLPLMSIRKNWNLMSENFKVGDLVLINPPDARRLNWLLGRILETYQGANDIVPTVKLKTRNGEMIRPASHSRINSVRILQNKKSCLVLWEGRMFCHNRTIHHLIDSWPESVK